MITINQPYIYSTGEKARLESRIYDDVVNKEFKIWYEVDHEYEKYLCTEVSDAFLEVCLQRAVYEEQDIHIQGNVSPMLLHNTIGVHIPFLATMFQKKEITVTSDRSQEIRFSGTAVGTGCSLGVDSLSTIYQHISSDCVPAYRLTHLTLFNTYHFGNMSQERQNIALEESRIKSQVFADEMGLPLVVVNTNLIDLVNDLPITNLQLVGYFTISCSLALQKLFSKYLFASNYSAEYTEMDYEDFEHAENIWGPLLGNENVEIIISDAFMKRTEKTRLISENPLTRKYLDVCWATFFANEKTSGSWYLEGRKHRNCGWCEKCRRTLITLDVLGKLSEYEDIFDIDKYNVYKKIYTVKVVANSKNNLYYRDIYEMMIEEGFPLPILGKIMRVVNVQNSRIFATLYSVYKRLKKIEIHAL